MPYSYRSGHVSSRRPTTARRYSRGVSNQQTINPAKFIKAAVPVQTAESYTPVNTFADFALHPLLASNMKFRNFAYPSPIQDKAIPVGLAGHDVVGVANTGTGKTIAFALPILHKIIIDRSSRALIMAPTRELAAQIEDECRLLAKGSGLHGALLIGGTSMGLQLRSLKERPSIVIGTPGRIKDHIERGSLNLAMFNIVALDEVDRMLDMGFVNDIRSILIKVAKPRQSFFFTATLDSTVTGLIREFSDDPITISVKTGETTDTIEQAVVTYSGKTERLDRLHELLLRAPKALVFDDTQHSVERLSKELLSRGFQADAIHGGKTQGQRKRALTRFKTSEINVLVATDVAARGLDVTDITHVINFSAPRTYDDYVHRIGRAGRAGRNGFAFTFIER